jgi:L-ascorbate metabolism protein UlaG (beta-lactamase superfamily)
MNGTEAARLAKAIGAKVVVPCHYDMFEFNTADPYELFVPECERIGQRYRVLKLGERFTWPEGS